MIISVSVYIFVLIYFSNEFHAFSFHRNPVVRYVPTTNLSPNRRSTSFTGKLSLYGNSNSKGSDSGNDKTRTYSNDRENKSRPRESSTRHSSIGQAKVARILRDELVSIITTSDIKAPNYPKENLMRGVSVSNIDFTSDLAIATVYLSILGNSVEKRQVYVWLCNNMGQIRYSLSQRLKNLRRLPVLKFSLVDSQSQFYLSDTLEEISRQQQGPGESEVEVEFEDDEGEDEGEGEGEETLS